MKREAERQCGIEKSARILKSDVPRFSSHPYYLLTMWLCVNYLMTLNFSFLRRMVIAIGCNMSIHYLMNPIQ